MFYIYDTNYFKHAIANSFYFDYDLYSGMFYIDLYWYTIYFNIRDYI